MQCHILCSLAVVVTRACDNRGVWLDPNFSGCTLSSGDPQVFVILSLNYFVNSDTDEEIRANEDFIKSEVQVQLTRANYMYIHVQECVQ